MKYILYTLIFCLNIIQLIVNNYDYGVYQDLVILILLLIILILLKERFFHHFIASFIVSSLFMLTIYMNPSLYLLSGIILLNLITDKKKYLFIFFSISAIVFLFLNFKMDLLIMLIFSSFLGLLITKKVEKQEYYIHSLDNERRIRYDLENAKQKLLQNANQIERLTEIKERNRIAQDIHDHLGHDIAGVLMQLQAADKVFDRNQNKVKEILSLCIAKLSNSLNVVHNTVHNIKPQEKLNNDIFKSIIDKFIYCPIEFHVNGDITCISTEILTILAKNLKEALTNATKYSGATLIDVGIEVKTNYVRFTYSDNGNGCKKIKEGLGLSGMRNRVSQCGGMMSIDGNEGFSLIYVIPHQKTNIF